MTKETVILPKELTAENGAKGLLSGEFFETIQVRNQEWCVDSCELGEQDCFKCDEVDEELKSEYFTQKVPVSWTTIKAIHKMVVKGMAK